MKSYDYVRPKHPKLVQVPCQNCGAPIMVVAGAIGCPMCEKCRNSGVVFSASTEQINKQREV